MSISESWSEPTSIPEARQLATRNDAGDALISAGRYLLYNNSNHSVSMVVEAERCFRRALEKMPDSLDALTYLGFSLDNQGRWTEARAIYEQVLELDPNHGLARERYAAASEELNLVEEPAR